MSVACFGEWTKPFEQEITEATEKTPETVTAISLRSLRCLLFKKDLALHQQGLEIADRSSEFGTGIGG